MGLLEVPREPATARTLAAHRGQQRRERARRQGGNQALEAQGEPERGRVGGAERGVAGERRREEALAAYAAFSESHAPVYRLALRLQRLVPALPPRALTALLAVLGRERPCRRAFSWYLDQAHPRFAA